MKQIRFDGEFDASKEWGNYCTEHGIQVEPTPSHSSQANSIVERSIGTLTADARTLLIDAGLPQKYWAEAVSYAVYMQNLILSAALPGKIPLEGWTKRCVNVSHL